MLTTLLAPLRNEYAHYRNITIFIFHIAGRALLASWGTIIDSFLSTDLMSNVALFARF